MASKEEFKSFVKDNPRLVQYVKSGDMTWQKFYEMYDLYGQENEVWKDYLKQEEVEKVAGTVGLADLVSMFKGIDLDSIQNGVNNLQRVLSVFQDFNKSSDTQTTETYRPRPIYKHFED